MHHQPLQIVHGVYIQACALCRQVAIPLETDSHPISLQLWELWGKNLQLSPDVWNVCYLRHVYSVHTSMWALPAGIPHLKLSLTTTFITGVLWGENLRLSL